MKLFVDSSALIAALDPTQDKHATTKAAVEYLAPHDELITTEVVISEAVSLVQRRYGRDGLRVLERSLGRLRIEWISREAFDRALAETLVASGRVSFVHRTSFAFMREHRIDVALTLDRDFADAGFETLP